MTGYTNSSRLAAYRSVASHGGVAVADPHGLILMLIDGALERIAAARGNMQHRRVPEKCSLIQRALEIVQELRASLDTDAGGEIARNLDSLYDFMARQLVRANAENRVELLDDVVRLLTEIRSAWVAMPADRRAR